jgi:hypothetical protein
MLASGQELQADQRITSKDGRYFLVLQGSDGNAVIYRRADMKDVWATGTDAGRFLAMQGDGNLVLYTGAGVAVWASNTFVPGSVAVLENDGSLRVVQPNPPFVIVGGPDPDPLPPPTNDVEGAKGLARAYGNRAVGDDSGPKLYVGLSRFPWLWFWKFERDRCLRELDADRKAGYRYGRVLAQVGNPSDPADFWAGRIVDPDWPDYQDLIAGLTNAAAERGHLILWTIIGKGGPYDQNQAGRRTLVSRVSAVLRDVPAGILIQEMMNEPNIHNSITASELLELADLAKATAPGILTASGAVWTEPGWVPDDPEWSGGFSPAGWARTQSDVGICHLDRDQSKSEMVDRPWRQGWDVGLESKRWIDNEPIGPGSSVNKESRPHVLRSHRAVAFVCRAFASCLHGKPGVRGDLLWEDEPAYLQAPKAIRFLPGNLPNGSQQNANTNYPDRPFTLSDPYVRAHNANTQGIVRCYSVLVDGVFYSIPFGPVSGYELKVERPLRVTCLQQDSGELLWERDVAAGDRIPFTPAPADYLLVSRPL